MNQLIKTLKQKWNNWRNPVDPEDVPLEATTRVIDTRTAISTPLTEIVGIGPTRAEKLNRLGIANVERLAELTAPILNSISGIGLATCDHYIAQAKEMRL